MSRFLITPNGNAGGFAFILAVMWYVGMAQGNSAAYLLFFLLLSVLLVSIPKTYSNLTSLQLSAESPKPAFVGEEISLQVELVNISKPTRCAITLSLPGIGEASELVDEVPGLGATRTVLRFPAAQRGAHEIPALSLASIYPLGILKRERQMSARQNYLVYPKPAGDPNLPRESGRNASATETFQPEGDDFVGVRPYHPGEAQRHIDWKAVARGHPLMCKQFAKEGGGALHLDFGSIPLGSVEAKLSQLALWIVKAEQAGRPYSISLPKLQIPASTGEAHYHQCLRALACYS